jgi:hypothetical protein
LGAVCASERIQERRDCAHRKRLEHEQGPRARAKEVQRYEDYERQLEVAAPKGDSLLRHHRLVAV